MKIREAGVNHPSRPANLSDLNGLTQQHTLRRFLIAAAIFHLLVTAGICVLGRYQVVPGVIDRNGIAITVASDGIESNLEAVQLSGQLTSGHVREWVNANSPFHIKLHSISFAILGPLFGSTILSSELINAPLYLAILTFVFHLGRQIFNNSAGFAAAAVVAVWPSFLLHTTQPLRDPLFVGGMLAFVFVNLRLLSRNLPWPSALLTAVGGGLIAIVLWLTRDTMKEVMIATAVIAGGLLLARQFTKRGTVVEASSGDGRRSRAPTLVGMALLITLTVGVTQIIPKFRRTPGSDPANAAAGQHNIWQNSRRQNRDALVLQETPSTNPLARLVTRVAKLRRNFAVEFSDAGSNIDSEVQITTTMDLVGYLPRAVMIGLFAPFPKMWFETGNQVSRGGRLLSGVETLAMYLVELLALLALWYYRRLLSVWFLWLVAGMGMIALGLVVINVGALYRMRYVFLILLIILATEGARLAFASVARMRSSRATGH